MLRFPPRPVEDVDSTLDALGGTGRVAARLGVTPPTVSGWRDRGRIPIEWWPALLMMSDEAGLGLTAHRLMEVIVGVPVPHGRKSSGAPVSATETDVLPGGSG